MTTHKNSPTEQGDEGKSKLSYSPEDIISKDKFVLKDKALETRGQFIKPLTRLYTEEDIKEFLRRLKEALRDSIKEIDSLSGFGGEDDL